MMTRFAALALVFGLLIPGMAGAQAKASGTGKAKSTAAKKAKAKVEITEPANKATVSSPVKIVMKTTGVEIVPATDERPGTGHHHLFVDHAVTPPGDTIPRGVTGILHLGRGQTEMLLDSLKPGPHRVIDVVGDSKHRPLKPMVSDTVSFTVK